MTAPNPEQSPKSDDAAVREIGDRAAALGAELRAIRTDLHRHPELSWQEHRTTSVVADRLTGLGLDVQRFDSMTGLTADIVLGDGPVIALRADLDALPLPELNGGDGISTVSGVSHACGHDVHTAALLGAARLLTGLARPVGGTVRLVFQPAEEAIPGGAPRVLASGRLADASAIVALHCDPSLPVGTFGVRPGAITSAADRIGIVLSGTGGHTARPHLTHDLIALIGRLVMDLPSRVADALAEFGEASVVFGQVDAGHAPNAIPRRAFLGGTLRTRARAVWDAAPEAVGDAVATLLGPSDVSWELDHQRGNPPVVNDVDVTNRAARALSALVGADAVVDVPQSLGSEDFSWYLDEMPGTYVRLGVAAGGAPGADLHRGDFDPHPDATVHGAAALVAIALDLLR